MCNVFIVASPATVLIVVGVMLHHIAGVHPELVEGCRWGAGSSTWYGAQSGGVGNVDAAGCVGSCEGGGVHGGDWMRRGGGGNVAAAGCRCVRVGVCGVRGLPTVKGIGYG